MVDLAPLNPDVHGKLKVEMSKGVYASKQHMFPLRVNEIAQAIGSFPVLISRVQNTGDLSLSCLCSFTPQTNLFVENGEWSSDFKPFALDTAPFHLVADPEDRTKPVTGIDQSSQLLNKNSGNDIFDNKGKPSLWVKQLGHRLLDDIQNQALTRQFLKSLEDHQLLSPIDIVLNFEDGTHNRIRGLNMVNEERLKSLLSLIHI